MIFDFIEKLPEKYKENFVYTKKENKGLADTKNVGIKLSRGKYISVVDSDDYISDDFYAIARKYIPENDIIIYDLYVVFEKSSKLNYTSRAKRDDKDNELVAYLSGAMSGSSCNKIIKKELYNGYSFPVGKEYEDTAVTPFILSDTTKIKYIPYPLYYYLQREKSIVANNTFVSAFYKICENITNVIKSKENNVEKYKYVVNEFFTDRALEILDEDLVNNRKEFLKDIQEFAVKNKDIINYILESKMIYNIENHYSPRQKDMMNNIFRYLSESQYNKIKSILRQRRVVNKIRRIVKWR